MLTSAQLNGWGRAVENWQVILSALHSWLDQASAFLTSLPTAEIIFAALFLPVALALFARSGFAFLGTLLLATLALLNVLEPTFSAFTLAICAYIGSLIVALSGIRARRRNAATSAELISLRNEVDELAQAESRRFVAELKTSAKGMDQQADAGPPVGNAKD